MLLHAKLTNPRLSSVVSTQGATKIEELIHEDHNVKRKREKFQLQSSLLSKVTRLLSLHGSRLANASWSNDSAGSGKLIPLRINVYLLTTPFVLNCKSFQLSWQSNYFHVWPCLVSKKFPTVSITSNLRTHA